MPRDEFAQSIHARRRRSHDRFTDQVTTALGSFALFTTLFLVFVKIFPSVSIYEVKETMDSPAVTSDTEPLAPPAPPEGSPA